MKNQDVWIRKRIAAAILDIGERWFDTQIRTRLPPEAVKPDGSSLLFDGSEVIKVWAALQKEKEPRQPLDEDAILASANTPEAEKLRKVKRQREEIRLARDRDEVIDKSAIEPFLHEVAGIYREGGDLLVKQFGNGAAEIIDEVIEEVERAIDRRFPADPEINGEDISANGEGAEADAPSDDPPVRGTRDPDSNRPLRGQTVSSKSPAVDRPVV